MQNGVLAGYALEALKITLIDGSFHPVDSDALSFEMAAKIGYKEAAQKAKPVLLEPIMKLEVVTPEDFMGDIIADLNRRRGQVESMDSRVGARVITAKVPLAEQFGCHRDVQVLLWNSITMPKFRRILRERWLKKRTDVWI